MIRPLENQERIKPGEYVNRVKHTEHGHGPGYRDFAYEIKEASHEGHRQQQPSHEFGEDTFEHSEEEPKENETPLPESERKPEDPEDGNLDITV
jgi:hypothetical protein